jgi:hypothetical protein
VTRRRRCRRAATNPIQPSRPHPQAARLLGFKIDGRALESPVGRLLRSAPAAFAVVRCCVPAPARAAQGIWPAGSHRYNRRLPHGRFGTAAAISDPRRDALGAQFIRYFKSAA